MVSSLLKMGLKSFDHLAVGSIVSKSLSARSHPLSAYPRLHTLLAEAERNGSLAAERRRLMNRRLSA